jgi:hypothetical protein
VDWIYDVQADMARARAHRNQLHFDFVNYCYKNAPRRPGIFAKLYDTPWDDGKRRVWFCKDECELLYRFSGDFEYPECDGCGMEVCTQNPSNGWHLQFRNYDLLGHVCLRCYQDQVLKNGQPRSDFEEEVIEGGMFFSYVNLVPKRAGFSEVPDFMNYFVSAEFDIKKYNSRALQLIGSEDEQLQEVGTNVLYPRSEVFLVL